MLILISDAFDASLPDKLARLGEVTDDKSRLPQADIVLVRSKTKCDKAFIDQAKKLKMIIRGGVGLDNIDRDYAAQKGIQAYNTARASSIAVAELAFALMIALPNKIIPGHVSMSQGQWKKNELTRTELFGKTLGLIGLGLIGSVMAQRGKAFGMQVIGYDKYLDSHPDVDLKDTLEDVLAQADYISLHTPLTDETKGMINKKTIAGMKDGAVLINTGRAKCIVREDVAEALHSGKLGGYATDVWYSDPPDKNEPICSAPNVIMTPHIGASTRENLLRIGDIVEELIEKFVNEQ